MKESFRQHKTATIIALLAGGAMFLYLLFQAEFPYVPVEPLLFKRMMWLIGLLLIVLFFFTFWAVEYKKMRLHRLALVLLPVLGVTYMTVIQINGSFDEDAHIPTVYHYANVLFGINDDELEKPLMYMRSDDAMPMAFNDPELPGDEPEMIIRPLSKQEYVDYWGKFGEPLRDETLVPVRQYRTTRTWKILPHQYIFSLTGMVIGRVLKLGTYDLYRLCRLFSLLFSTLLTAHAIKLLPVRKSLLLLIAILPLTVQQSMSVSYDPFVDSLAFWSISALLYVSYGMQGPSGVSAAATGTGKGSALSGLLRNRRALYLAGISLACLALATSKQFAYIAFLAVPFYAAYRMGYMSKKTFFRLFYAAIALAVLGVVVFFVRYRTGGEASPMNEFVLHLLMRIRLYVHTLVEQIGMLFQMSIGSVLGALLIDTATGPVFFFIPLLLLASVKREDERLCLTGFDRFCFIALFLVCLTASGFGHMIITPLHYSTVFGLQGRYILPVLFPLLYATANNRLTLKGSTDALLISGGVCLNFFLVVNILANA